MENKNSIKKNSFCAQTHSTSSSDDHRFSRIKVRVVCRSIVYMIVIDWEQPLVVVFVSIELEVDPIFVEQILQTVFEGTVSSHFDTFPQSVPLKAGPIDIRALVVLGLAVHRFVSHSYNPRSLASVLRSVGLPELCLQPVVLIPYLIPTELMVIIEFCAEGQDTCRPYCETVVMVIHLITTCVDH